MKKYINIFTTIVALCVALHSTIYARTYSKVDHFSFKEVNPPKFLGTVGQTYEPIENDTWEIIANAEINATDIKQKLEKAKQQAMTVSLGTPTCDHNTTKVIDISFTVDDDVYLYGLPIAKKGQVVNPLKYTKGIRKNILFFNIDNEEQKKLADSNITDSKSVVLATDGNLAPYAQEGQEIMKASTQILNKYQVECVPAIVSLSPDEEKLQVFQFIPIKQKTNQQSKQIGANDD